MPGKKAESLFDDRTDRQLGELFGKADFSKYTDLKARLAKKLFEGREKESSRIIQGHFSHISEQDAALINAAGGIPPIDPFRGDNKKDLI